MPRGIVFIFLAALFAFVSPGGLKSADLPTVQPFDGHQLAAACSKAEAVCESYVEFVAGLLSTDAVYRWNRVCIDDAMSEKDLVRVVVTWLNANSAHLKLPAFTLVVSALNERFPCE